MSDTQPDPGTSDDHADSAEFADVVLDRLVPVIGEFPRADAGKLGLDHAMLAVLGVLRIVAPLAVASLAGRCALSHAAAARAVGRLVERGYVERITEEGDGRSSWWVGPTALADETLASARAGLRADLTRTATYLTPHDRLAVLRVLPTIVDHVSKHAHARRESLWRETQHRRWKERHRERF